MDYSWEFHGISTVILILILKINISINTYIYIYLYLIYIYKPVVLHKAVAEVSKIGNL